MLLMLRTESQILMQIGKLEIENDSNRAYIRINQAKSIENHSIRTVYYQS